MRLRRRKQFEEAAIDKSLANVGAIRIPNGAEQLAQHVFNELRTLRATVTDLNQRLMQLEGDEYEDNDDE